MEMSKQTASKKNEEKVDLSFVFPCLNEEVKCTGFDGQRILLFG